MKIALLLIVLTAFVCPFKFTSAGPNEEFVQGSWRSAGDLADGDEVSMSWLMEWKFEDGEFEQNGYPPLKQKGRYEVLEEDEDTLKIRLFDQDGTFGKGEREIEIRIDRNGDTIKIDSIEGFKRFTP